MNSKEIREAFVSFFRSKGHKIIGSAPMVIKDDPSLMFTNAGMNQFKDIFLNSRKVSDLRIVNSQKCLRVSGKHNDLEDVGHDTYHHTMFEMLGNWSFGDYFKEDAIAWAWELLTDVYEIDKSRIYITVFGGDKFDELAEDADALNIWSKYVEKNKILYGSKKDNFWEMGDTGPCGPCSEIHIDLRDDNDREILDGSELVNKDHPLVVEIWNLVFIQYNRKSDSSLELLPAKHVDTGMGFERLCMVLQGKKSNYDTDIFQNIIASISELSDIEYGENKDADIALRVISDHLRAVSFAIADGQLPSNVKAGYVIRRILRRAVRYGYSFLGFKEPFIYKLVNPLVQSMGDAFPELKLQENIIEKVIYEEERVFLRTLDKGIKMLEQKITDLKKKNISQISGIDAFILFDTYGFPIDLTDLIARENEFSVDIEGFEKEMSMQKKRGRNDANIVTGDWINISEFDNTSFVGYDALETTIQIVKYRKVNHKNRDVYQLVFDRTPFYAEAGGQTGDTGVIFSSEEKIDIINTITEHNLTIHISEKLPQKTRATFTATVDKEKRLSTARNHSATHLMHEALRTVLGSHVEQKGSLVDENRLRFDFSHFNKLSDEEIRKVEQIVNSQIRKNFPLEEHRQIAIEDAKGMGAISLFGEKYGDTVRVIKFNNAIELCGGTHVGATGEIGFFKILTESAIAAGIRRIEAFTGSKCEELIYEQFDNLKQISFTLNSPKDSFKAVENILNKLEEQTNILENFRKAELNRIRKSLIGKSEKNNNFYLITDIVEVESVNDLKEICSQIRSSNESFVCTLGSIINGKPNIIVAISENLVKEYNLNASIIVREAAKAINGGGGGQAFVATAGGNDPNGMKRALENAKNSVLAKIR